MTWVSTVFRVCRSCCSRICICWFGQLLVQTGERLRRQCLLPGLNVVVSIMAWQRLVQLWSTAVCLSIPQGSTTMPEIDQPSYRRGTNCSQKSRPRTVTGPLQLRHVPGRPIGDGRDQPAVCGGRPSPNSSNQSELREK